MARALHALLCSTLPVVLLSACSRSGEPHEVPREMMSGAPGSSTTPAPPPVPPRTSAPAPPPLLETELPGHPGEGPENLCHVPDAGAPSDEDVVIAYVYEGGIGYSIRDLVVRRNGAARFTLAGPGGGGPFGFPKDWCEGPLSRESIASFLQVVAKSRFCENAPSGKPTWATHGHESLCVHVEGKTCFGRVSEGDEDSNTRAILSALARLSALTCASERAQRARTARDGG